MRFTTLAACCLLSATGARAEPACSEHINFSAPSGRYQIAEGGEAVIDSVHDLIWLRCPQGYQVDEGGTRFNLADDRCVVAAEILFDWQAALQSAVDFNNNGTTLAGVGEWRLPNTKELDTLVENRCNWPSINTRHFPDTPSIYFWTNTAWRDTSAMAVGFSEGRILPSGKIVPNAVRLVTEF